MAHKNKIQVVADKGKQDVFIIREFDAPRELVWKAFSDPELLVQFFGPEKVMMKVDRFDFKDGGSYRYSHFDQKGNLLCAFNGVIHEATAPERIIQTSEFEGLPERGNVVLEAILFDALPGDRTKLTIHDVCRSVETRDMMIKSGMEHGLAEGFDRLDNLLEKGILTVL